jgi:hypothetical protein
MPGYRWLQYLSSLVGAVILVAWLVHWWKRTEADAPPGRPAPWWPWALLGAVGVAVGLPVALAADGLGQIGFDGTAFGGGAALAAAVVLAAGWHLRRRPTE